MVFITLEDEFGHIPLMVFPQVYERHEHKFKSPFLVIKGKLSRREGTHNVVVTQVKPFKRSGKSPSIEGLEIASTARPYEKPFAYTVIANTYSPEAISFDCHVIQRRA